MSTSIRPHQYQTFKILALALGLSYAAGAILFTDLFWLHNQRFMGHQDTEVPFENVFALVSFYYQGAIQLFNRFDGMNYAYSQLTSGFYTVSNVLTATIYALLYPFMDDPARGLHEFMHVVFHGINMFIRTFGTYVLLRRFGLYPGVIVASLVFLNTFFSVVMYFGLLTNNLYSYFPLLAYFILEYIEKFRFKDFLSALVLMCICVSNSALFALGYFYQNVHFFILSSVAYALLFCRRQMNLRAIFSLANAKRMAITLAVVGVMLAPWVMMADSLKNDFYIADSGLGGTEGRVKSMFNPAKYFKPKGEIIISIAQLPTKIIEFTNNWWDYSWTFWGVGAVFLLVMGLVTFKNRMKYIFAAAIFLVVLANVPLSSPFPLSLAHWINALTNPFSFLLRTYHMPILLIPFMAITLVAFGLQACVELIKEKEDLCRIPRVPVIMGLLILAIAWAAWQLPLDLKVYALSMMGVLLLFLYLVWNKEPLVAGLERKILILIVGLGAIGTEAWALSNFYRMNVDHGKYFAEKDGLHLKPIVFDGFEDNRNFILEYQEPTFLPWRDYVRITPSVTTPWLHTEQNNYGLVYKYNALERFLVKPNIYSPRPIEFKEFHLDGSSHRYIAEDQRFLIFAIGSEQGPHQELGFRAKNIDLAVSKARAFKKDGFKLYQWRLPSEFPAYLATAVFTQDRGLMMMQDSKRIFLPVQGALVAANSFDVNNVRRGFVTVAVALDQPLEGLVRLNWREREDVVSVTHHAHDKIGFVFRATADGWLKTRLPYNDKWQVRVDGKRIDTKRVDGYFLGFPLSGGEHNVLIEYWPQSPLRYLIVISIILTLAALFYLMRYAARGN